MDLDKDIFSNKYIEDLYRKILYKDINYKGGKKSKKRKYNIQKKRKSKLKII